MNSPFVYHFNQRFHASTNFKFPRVAHFPRLSSSFAHACGKDSLWVKCSQGSRGLAPWRGLQEGSVPLPKKILYLVGIRYAILLPIFVKNCSILTPNYLGKTWLGTENCFWKLKNKKTNKLTTTPFRSSKKLRPPFQLIKKVMTHPHILEIMNVP